VQFIPVLKKTIKVTEVTLQNSVTWFRDVGASCT